MTVMYLSLDIKKFSYVSETRNVLICLVTGIFIDSLDLGQVSALYDHALNYVV